MSLVYGDNVNLYLKLEDVDDYAIILCNKSCSLDISTEIAERTTVESGSFKQFKPLGLSGSLQADGDIDHSVDLGVSNLVDWQLDLATIYWLMETISDDSTTISYSGRGIIEKANITGPVNAPASFSISLIVDGAITKI